MLSKTKEMEVDFGRFFGVGHEYDVRMSSTRILRSIQRRTKTVPAAKRKTESNRREKTLNSGRVSSRSALDSEGEDGSEMSDVRRYID